MKTFVQLVCGVAFLACVSGAVQARQVYVPGHYRSNGTYAQPYYRTVPDSMPYDNYPAYGNVNPYTGPGMVAPNPYQPYYAPYQQNNAPPPPVYYNPYATP
ncbi:MAG TPA: hypothetical protein VKB94_09605 [Rhizomicrobium sp.]|nr:hypothetical protein [Rhizomicrobium sp.]